MTKSFSVPLKLKVKVPVLPTFQGSSLPVLRVPNLPTFPPFRDSSSKIIDFCGVIKVP